MSCLTLKSERRPRPRPPPRPPPPPRNPPPPRKPPPPRLIEAVRLARPRALAARAFRPDPARSKAVARGRLAWPALAGSCDGRLLSACLATAPLAAPAAAPARAARPASARPRNCSRFAAKFPGENTSSPEVRRSGQGTLPDAAVLRRTAFRDMALSRVTQLVHQASFLVFGEGTGDLAHHLAAGGRCAD